MVLGLVVGLVMNGTEIQASLDGQQSNPDRLPLNFHPSQISIRIRKADRKLDLIANGKIKKSYDMVLGPDPVNDKRREGDGCTPEGQFKLRAKYPHAKWSYFLWIDYPTQDSYRKHAESKRRGEIPANAEIGGDIGIHGVPEGRNDLIDKKVDWTLGCISLTTESISEIYPLVQEGTPVEIQK